MSFALQGSHYCTSHQGNHSTYAPQNCQVCQLEAHVLALRAQFSAAAQNERRLLLENRRLRKIIWEN